MMSSLALKLFFPLYVNSVISPKEILCEGNFNKNPWGFRSGKKGSKLGRLNFHGCFILDFCMGFMLETFCLTMW